MKYIPNLIPEHSRVHIDFNKSFNSKPNKVWEFTKYLLLVLSGIFLLIGVINIALVRFYVAFPLLLIGVILIPDVHRNIEEVLRFKFNLKIKSALIAICLLIASIALPGYQKEESELAAIEKAKEHRALIEEKKRKQEEEEKQKMQQEFLTVYPFITASEYNNWLTLSKDSINNPHYTRSNFVSLKKKVHIKRQQDSIKLAKEEEQIQRREEKKRKLEQQRIYEANTEYYNGHVVHTGPRGGRYYINSNGNKTYIPR